MVDVGARHPGKWLPISGSHMVYGMRTSLDLSGMPRPSSTHKIIEVGMHGIDLPLKRKGKGAYQGEQCFGSGYITYGYLGVFLIN
jgi:hypothetical protein